MKFNQLVKFHANVIEEKNIYKFFNTFLEK